MTNTATGAAVNDYAFNVVDAEETSVGEGISVDNGDTSYVIQPVKYLTPPENSQTCSVRGAAGSEATGWSVIEPSPAQQRDFICENTRSNPGSFVTTVNRPKQFTVTTWTDVQQGFALAFTLGRAGGLLKGDTTALNGGVSNGSTYEKQAFGAETDFDLSIWNTVSTAQSPFVYIPRPGASGAIGPQDGNLVGYLGVPGNAPDGSPTGTGTNPRVPTFQAEMHPSSSSDIRQNGRATSLRVSKIKRLFNSRRQIRPRKRLACPMPLVRVSPSRR